MLNGWDEQLAQRCQRRTDKITLPGKLPAGLDGAYLRFLEQYRGGEITADCCLYGYEQALEHHRYLEREHPEFSRTVWPVGSAGNGDEWFFARGSNTILYYDHDAGQYDAQHVEDMRISFTEFVELHFLYRELEDYLDRRGSLTDVQRQDFARSVNAIRDGLFEDYPFTPPE